LPPRRSPWCQSNAVCTSRCRLLAFCAARWWCSCSHLDRHLSGCLLHPRCHLSLPRFPGLHCRHRCSWSRSPYRWSRAVGRQVVGLRCRIAG
jgi:hypothetical protein